MSSIRTATRLARIAAATLVIATSAVTAAPAVTPSQLAFLPLDSGVLGNAGSLGGWGWAGSPMLDYTFSVSTPITVTDLAHYLYPGGTLSFCSVSGVACAVQVSINVESTGEVVTQALISEGSPLHAVSTNVSFLHSAVSPVTLQPGVTYQVWQTQPGTSVFYGAYTTFGADFTAAPWLMFGGNFYYTPAVPESGTFEMTLLGLLLFSVSAGYRAGRRRFPLPPAATTPNPR